MQASPPCKWRLTAIQVPKIASQLHAGPISPLSRAQGVGLTFMQVPPHLILGAGNCISAPPRSHLTSINVWRIASHLHSHSGPVSHQTPKIQIRVSPLSDAAHVVFHIVLNVPVWGCLISIWWDEGSHQHWTHGWSAVDCIWEITSIGVFCSVSQHNITEVPSGVINENNTRPLGDHWTVHHTLEKRCSLEVR